MNIAENTAILLSFRGWVATPVDAMAGIEAQSHVGRRGHIKQPFRFLRRFDVRRHVRMEHQVKAKVVGHATSISDYFCDVLPLLRGERGASVSGDSTRNPVTFGRLGIGQNQERRLQRREQVPHFSDLLDCDVGGGWIAQDHGNKRCEKCQVPFLQLRT